jgi:hypothetical protein
VGLLIAELALACGEEGRSETLVPLDGPLYALDINSVNANAENGQISSRPLFNKSSGHR